MVFVTGKKLPYYGAMKTKTILTTLLMLTLCATAAAQGDSSQVEKRDKALVQYAFDGELTKVQSVVAKGASVDATGPKKRTALLWAAANGHTSIVEFLHSKDANINAKDSNGQTALMFAVKGSHVEAVEYLLENGADIDARSIKQGFTALITAAAVGDVRVVRLLLEHGADKSIAERNGNTALDRARQYDHPDIAALLEDGSAPASSS